VARIWFRITLAAVLVATFAAAQVREAEPPEEDAGAKKIEYAFNPLKAEQEMKVGDFYWKRGSYQAAAGRYKEASLWNPGLAAAFLKLGECYQKLKQVEQAHEAFEKYLAIEPDGKRAAEVRKRIDAKAK